jgi:hypothetical protein
MSTVAEPWLVLCIHGHQVSHLTTGLTTQAVWYSITNATQYHRLCAPALVIIIIIIIIH